MLRICILTLSFFGAPRALSQAAPDSFYMYGDVKISIDPPACGNKEQTVLVLYALPNGNTTAQTMGKKIRAGEDWHFDIQHIKAQTVFIRERTNQPVVVAYLENRFRSWPLWKQTHSDHQQRILRIVDTLIKITGAKSVQLNGHSGGGNFIFGYLDAVEEIPGIIERISFLDSNYGYDSSHYQKFKNWLQSQAKATITVFAYNDSIALYHGKAVVSEKGGTWYKSGLMLRQFKQDFEIGDLSASDSLLVHADKNKRIGFFLKTNPDRIILHTRQVELNGFIHSVLFGTRWENQGYSYFGPRAYEAFIR